jgi:hypothetical protein
VLGLVGWAPHTQATAIDPAHVQSVLLGIAQDIAAIYDAFAGGFDDPHSPVNDPASLRAAASRLDSATAKANELRAEVQP